MCVGKDRQSAKREVKEEMEVLPGSDPDYTPDTNMKSVMSRHGAKLPSAWEDRLLRNIPEVLRQRRPRWQQPSSVRAAHRVSELS
jgi:hypothetical protein